MSKKVKNGKYVNKFGTKEWYLEGKRHRLNGPAIEFPDGSKSWYLEGERHREDGPAVDLASGTKYWYLNGKRHREDGPAAEYINGDKEWYVNGVQYSKKEFNQWLEKKNLNERLNQTLDEKPSKKRVKI